MRAAIVAVLALLIASCSGEGDVETTPVNLNIQLNSTAFSEGGNIPVEHTCDGANVSPHLWWSGLPSGTRSMAIVVDDPDAPGRTFVHWVLYNIPSNLGEIAPGTPPAAAQQGRNDFGNTGYGGPCPPRGAPHRYFFKIYALDEMLELEPGLAKEELLDAMDGRILAQGQLMGRYERQ